MNYAYMVHTLFMVLWDSIYGTQHVHKSSENILKAFLDFTQGFYKYVQRQRLGRTTVRVLIYSVPVRSVWPLYTVTDQY